MNDNQYDIFISYRREGGAQYARILKAELEKRGYRNRVFLDYDELKDGRFDSRIMSAIENAPVFIFILSPGSLDRCINEDDWVRQEIVYAMEHERHIIPINFDGRFNGFPLSIPNEVKEALGQHQFTKIDSESLLNVSVEKLINERIAPIVSPKDSSNQSNTGAEIVIITDSDCQVFRFGKLIARAKADMESTIHLMKANHLLEFVSRQCAEVKEKIKYSLPDNDYADFIEVNLRERVLEQMPLFPYKNSSGKWGFVEKSGKFVIPCVYDGARVFSEGLAEVKKEGKWGYIDKGGKLVVPCIYDETYGFSEGCAAVEKDGKWGYIDKDDKFVIPCIYDETYGFSEGLACIMIESKWGYIDKTAKFVIPCLYANAGQFSEGLAAVIKDGKWGFIDKSGKLVIPCIYDYAGSFSEGLAAVIKDGKWGFIDKGGQLVIPCIYSSSGYISEGLAAVIKDGKWGKWGFIDKDGKLVIPCIYDRVFNFIEGLACVEKDGRKGYVDKAGNVVIPFGLE